MVLGGSEVKEATVCVVQLAGLHTQHTVTINTVLLIGLKLYHCMHDTQQN